MGSPFSDPHVKSLEGTQETSASPERMYCASVSNSLLSTTTSSFISVQLFPYLLGSKKNSPKSLLENSQYLNSF